MFIPVPVNRLQLELPCARGCSFGFEMTKAVKRGGLNITLFPQLCQSYAPES
jgi:hypothetical protein